MSKHKHKQAVKDSVKNDVKAVKKPAKDSFQNPLARLGVGTENLMNATNYPLTRLTRDYNLMNSLYRNSWIVKKIINVIPEDMCKNWFSFTGETPPEIEDRFKKLQTRTKIKDKILEGLMWGRLYGGAAALILIDGDEDRLDEPLIVDDIMPNSFKGLFIVDRWSGIYPSNELITYLDDPDFGLPEYYEVRDLNGVLQQKVHHSRLIRFEGRKLPYFEDIAELQWGASEVEHVFDELVKRDNTSWNIAALVFQANLLIDKVDGLDQMLTLADSQAQEDFYRVKQAQNMMRNSNALMLIGKEEEINALQYTFSGLSDIYNDFMCDISGACDIPVTRLFGRSPAGMNSTGESDMQMYYDMISSQQNSILRPKLDKLLPIMFMSEFGKLPKDLDIQFNPIKTPSDQEVADLVSKKVGAIKDTYDAGIINQRIAMEELHEMSYTTNMFSSITDEDIANAKEDFEDESGGINAFDLGQSKTSPKQIPKQDTEDN